MASNTEPSSKRSKKPAPKTIKVSSKTKSSPRRSQSNAGSKSSADIKTKNHQIKILILEDDANDERLLKEELDQANIFYSSKVVPSVPLFLAELKKYKPDLVIADYSLMKFDGLAALKLAKDLTPDIPIVLITDLKDERTAVECMKAGASDYVLKDNLIRLGAEVIEEIDKMEAARLKREVDEKFRESERLFRMIAENTVDLITVVDIKGDRLYVSPSFERLVGADSDLIGRNAFCEIDPTDRKRLKQVFNNTIKTGVGQLAEYKLISRDGEVRMMESQGSIIYDNDKRAKQVLVISRDITERHSTERKLKELASMAEYSPIPIIEIDITRKVRRMNPIARNLWPDLENDEISDEDIIPDIEKMFTELLDKRISHNVRTTEYQNRIYEQHVHFVRGAQLARLYSVDITEKVQSEQLLRDHVNELKRTLECTIEAMATAVEMRDPYTAGHQKRVAKLAGLIATEMGLSEDIIRTVELAATIHDVGKLCVPAEMLSKPGKLTDPEFGVIKAHAKTGYDILKSINFPEPIHKIAMQHHEKNDGSGYPLGLTEDNILLESKIIAVADVVEAMSSHRPYRPSLGAEVAIDEIKKKRGKHFDPKVVDACIKVIKDKKYDLTP